LSQQFFRKWFNAFSLCERRGRKVGETEGKHGPFDLRGLPQGTHLQLTRLMSLSDPPAGMSMAKRAEELGSRRGITRPQAGEFGYGSHKNRQGPECRTVRWGDRAGGWRQPAAPSGDRQRLRGSFGVRRLVAALEIVYWLRDGSLLPFSGETNACFQTRRGNPGSKLPVRGSSRLFKAATSRRTPNAPSVKTHAALGGTSALHRNSLPTIGYLVTAQEGKACMGYAVIYWPESVIFPPGARESCAQLRAFQLRGG